MKSKTSGSALSNLTLLVEFVGTGFFTYLVLVSDMRSIEHTISLYMLVLLLGALAGGHFNPATTVGVYASEGCQSHRRLLHVLLSQFTGSMAGLVLSLVGKWSMESQKVPHIVEMSDLMSIHAVNPVHNAQLIFPMNIMCTFVMVSTILILMDRLPCE